MLPIPIKYTQSDYVYMYVAYRESISGNGTVKDHRIFISRKFDWFSIGL